MPVYPSAFILSTASGIRGIMLVSLIFLNGFINLFPQALSQKAYTNSFFIQPEIMFGYNVPNYTDFPETAIRQTIGLNIGVHCADTLLSRSTVYNFPQYGMNFLYSDLGNDSLLGREFSIAPFLVFSPFKNGLNSFKLRLALGLSYFTRFYDPEHNRLNKAIGSGFTWSFQGGIQQRIYIGPKSGLYIGLCYLHASNGHTQLPNFGLNAAMVNFSYQFYTGSGVLKGTRPSKWEGNKRRCTFLFFRQGNGINELGGTSGPVGGRKGYIFSSTIGGGILFRNHIGVRSGFTYRYYDLQYRFAEENDVTEYARSSGAFASNVYFFAAGEFLIGHAGLDIEGGINLYKPFYPKFFEEFEYGSHFSYICRKIFPCRIGLNWYLLDTEKNPEHNIGIGAHINANFGEADFSEFSIIYVRRFNSK